MLLLLGYVNKMVCKNQFFVPQDKIKLTYKWYVLRRSYPLRGRIPANVGHAAGGNERVSRVNFD